MNRSLLIALTLLTVTGCERTTTEPAGPKPLAGPTRSQRIQAAVAASDGRIAFTSTRDGTPEIYVMNADGTGQTRLTTNGAPNFTPAWSPDGAKIAFTSDRDGSRAIYVMNADGTGQTKLSTNQRYDVSPAWSPDGTKIAFTTQRDGNAEIYVMNADGTGLTRLTTDPASDGSPTWSPDGAKIAFQSTRDGNYEIYVMNADGTGQARLTTNPAMDGDPVWSPNGATIAFTSTRDGNYEIYVMNADGTGPTRLTTDLAADETPTWSPDGAMIAFTSTRDGGFDIYVMNADGTGLTRLTTALGFDDQPSWGLPADVTPPTITAPPSVTVNTDLNKCSATVDPGTATATDDRGVPTVTRSPSGSLFNFGSTSILWTATDAAGNTSTASQTVTVNDAQRPSIILLLPVNLSVGTDPGKAFATVDLSSTTATDNCPGLLFFGTRSDGKLLSAGFPLGTTTITWDAMDASGNVTGAQQHVTVQDLEPPSVTVPADFAVDATSTSGATVSYAAGATDNVGVVSFACAPASGNAFSIGVQTVTCDAADAAGNTAQSTFRVTVKGADQQISDFEDAVAGLDLQEGTETSLEQKLEAALASLASGQLSAAAGQLQALINQVNAQIGKKITAEEGAMLIARARQILAVIGS